VELGPQVSLLCVRVGVSADVACRLWLTQIRNRERKDAKARETKSKTTIEVDWAWLGGWR